jgi:hypothetical protein
VSSLTQAFIRFSLELFDVQLKIGQLPIAFMAYGYHANAKLTVLSAGCVLSFRTFGFIFLLFLHS